MTKDDINTLILFSFRYAIDRKTGAFEDVCGIIKRHKLPDWVKDQVIRDCILAIKIREDRFCDDNIIECEKLLLFLRGVKSE